jgi:glycine dehydrogenase
MEMTLKFHNRHIGPTTDQEKNMLNYLGELSVDDICNKALTENITDEIPYFSEMSEFEYEEHIQSIGQKNTITISLIGQGFHPNYCPSVIRRNVLENPSWYTQYTPYQAEISQGRLEALFNFQTIICELTGLPVANASLLDEGNACSEALFMAYQNATASKIFIDKGVYQNSINVIQTRFKYLNVEIEIGSIEQFKPTKNYFAVLVQQFSSDGKANDYSNFFAELRTLDITSIICTDLLAITLFKSPGEMDADIAVGSGQRFGVPMGFGGPSAAFISCKSSFTRNLPGRIIGLSKDKFNVPAYRMALQTREQHIRREKATSNICTAQSLLAIINSFYVIYYGPENLKEIAKNIHAKATAFYIACFNSGIKVKHPVFFDTVTIETENANLLTQKALDSNIEWIQNENEISIAFNECLSSEGFNCLLEIFEIKQNLNTDATTLQIPSELSRKTPFLTQEVFKKYTSETKMCRYIKYLEQKDLSLTHSMIPLGSCTMKLNSTTELLSLSNPDFSNIHPLSNPKFTKGYQEILLQLEIYLANITGFDATSLQPNSGAQGEFAGLLCIRDYLKSIGEGHRDIALIPTSAHGTNPASAKLCGLKIIPVNTSDNGEICYSDLQKKIDLYKNKIAVLMITTPSTYGIFDSNIQIICDEIHKIGGQVYMDGANMNAQVGLTSPSAIGADVCHLNLHKTFCIPHGGGGPGVGPICVKKHLTPFMPSKTNRVRIANALYGSASICLISYAYIRMMGSTYLKKATQIAILNANYIAKRLSPYFEISYKNKNGFVAHELIIDCKSFKKSCKISVEDIAKRLMDYGFHAPTMSWPVADSLMIEPTESEDKNEIDRFCNALIQIKKEIELIETKVYSITNNPLINAPHTQRDVANEWTYPYSTAVAFFPSGQSFPKFWPSVNRINNAYGDRNLICSCQNQLKPSNVRMV